MNFNGKRTYFPTIVNLLLKMIDYEPVHRTTIYLWIKKYHQKDLIDNKKVLEWFQKRAKRMQASHKKPQKNQTPKEVAHKQYPEAKLLGTHIEFLTRVESILGKETFIFMEKYAPEVIEKLRDSFHFEKYRKNKLRIETIVRKRNNADS
jgi:hypothetical protein